MDFDKIEKCEAFERHYMEEQAPDMVVKSWMLSDFIKINKIGRYLFCYDYYSATDGGEPAIIFYAKDGRSITVYTFAAILLVTYINIENICLWNLWLQDIICFAAV